jgi:hypothetical protein
MALDTTSSLRYVLEDEESREYLKKVIAATWIVAENCPDDYELIFDMLGIGDGPKFENNKTSRQLRGTDYLNNKPKNTPEPISPRVQAVRLQALRMAGLAPRADSTEMDG